MEESSRLFTIIHPVVLSGGDSLAVFQYVIHEDEETAEINIFECLDVQLLPSEKEIERYGLLVSNQIRPDSDSLFLRKEAPLYIRSEDDLAVLRENLVDKVMELLQYSEPYRR